MKRKNVMEKGGKHLDVPATLYSTEKESSGYTAGYKEGRRDGFIAGLNSELARVRKVLDLI